MLFDQLPAEIWDRVVRFLAIPMPKPLSGVTKEEAVMEVKEVVARLPHLGVTGTTSRSDVKASDLARLMRTSIAFNQHASKPLYKSIICDDFTSLLSHFDSPPAHPMLQSKFDLCQTTEYLHLEYSQKSDQPTYIEIIVHGKTAWIEVGACSASTWAAKSAVDELDRLLMHLRDSTAFFAFDQLHHLTFGAIFGSQHEVWRMAAAMYDLGGRIEERVRECNAKVERIFHNSLLQEFCQRVSAGPLSMPPIIITGEPLYPDDPPLKPDYNIHFEMRNKVIPAAMWHRTRWILEEHERKDLLLRDTGGLVLRQLDAAKQQRTLRPLPKSGFHLDVYASSDRGTTAAAGVAAQYIRPNQIHIVGAGKEKELVQRQEAMMLEEMRRPGGRWGQFDADNLSWRTLGEAVPCKACGWAFSG